jgi:dimethylamine corrinoid protein
MAGAKKAETMGKMVLGTIEGDVHDIGKGIVSTLWGAAGYTVNDIGIDVPIKKFVLEAKLSKADIVGISCSMNMCLPSVGKLVAEFKKAGLREKVKIMDGGQCATLNDVEHYGIDAHGLDANDALAKAGELMRILKEERLKKGIA